MNAFFVTVAVLMFLCALTASTVYLFTQKRRAESESIEKISLQEARPLIISQLQSVSELALVKSNFHSTVSFEESKKILGHSMPGTKRKFILSYGGTVTCGCDLSKIRVASSFTNNRNLKIILPQSEIFHIYPDLNTVELHEKDTGIFADDISLEEQNQKIMEDVENVKRRLVSEGILLKSNDNMIQTVKSITEPMDIKANIFFMESNRLSVQSELPRLS